jgi:SapC
MQISPPFGYQEVVPFLKTHKVRLLAPGEAAPFVRQGAAVPISHTEFQPAARHYPIVFLGGGEKPVFNAVAVVGISPGENLFVDDGTWASGIYIPAYARRYPFCMATVKVNNVAQQNRLICVEKSALDDSGEAMFDASAQPTEKWKSLEKLLAEYEADLERTREMCSILSDYGLLEPFTMQAKMNPDKGGAAMQLTGMYRVAEQNIENLNAAQLKNLIRKGVLARIYIHLLSLEHFGGLLDRKAARGNAT